jgi:hypothetical protein
MITLPRTVGAMAALALTVGLAWLSAVPLQPYASDTGVLRLAWRARPERIEVCRPQSEEVLARLPAHMRQAMICEGATAAYRLEVRRNGEMVMDDVVRGGGLRHDRPLYVFREIAVPNGVVRVNVRFTRIEAGPARQPDDSVQADDAQRRRILGEVVPPALVFERDLSVQPRAVILVTYDPADRQLRLVEP